MMARIAILALLAVALVAGGGLYYLQVYAYYDEVEDGLVEAVSLTSGEAEAILFEDFQGIDANSSPLRYRACFSTFQSIAQMSESYVLAKNPTPREAPGWFDCFDAAAIGADLEEGQAVAFLSRENVVYGIDRVIAIYPDGRGYAWHDINDCGEVVFDGQPAPDGCPTPPSETN